MTTGEDAVAFGVDAHLARACHSEDPCPRAGTPNDENAGSAAYSDGTGSDGRSATLGAASPFLRMTRDTGRHLKLLPQSTCGRIFFLRCPFFRQPERVVVMEVVHERCAGLDVHKRTVVACVLRSEAGGAVHKTTRTFDTMLPGLQALRQWMLDEGCTCAAMEATGVYWKPVYNVLEDALALIVFNAEHYKALRGRKTDVKDAERIAEFLRHDLLKGSFIPARPQRELRELTRFRTALQQDRARAVNRLQKTLEGANIKLASVLTDITGVSGQRILGALLRGEDDPAQLAELAHWRLAPKRQALEHALMGQLGPRLRFVVAAELRQITDIDEQIAACDAEVAEQMRPFARDIARLDGIPGVGERLAQILIAELGTDLSRWSGPGALAAWAGICPGNKESAGKRVRVRARKGNVWVRRALTEAGWAAGRSKQSYLGARYRHFAARRGRKHAVVATGHEILTIIYYVLSRQRDYADLGLGHLEDRRRANAERQAVRQLERLGYHVVITAA